MATLYNTSVVTNGLVMNLDAANPKSYSPNIVPNPTNLFSWNGTAGLNNCTISRDLAPPAGNSPAGGIALKMAVTGGDPHIGSYNSTPWNLAPAAAGQTWTVSVWVSASQVTDGELLLCAVDATGNAFAANTWIGSATVAITTGWTRVSYTGTIPGTATAVAFIQCRLDGPTAASPAGINVWWDGLQIERAAAASTFNPVSNTTNSRWFDTGPNKYTAFTRGVPTKVTTSGGAITTPQNQVTNYVELPEAALQGLLNGNTWTLEWANTLLTHDGTRYGPHMTVTGGNDFIWQWNAGDSTLFAATALVSGTNPTWTLNVPSVYTLTRSYSNWRIYKNGVFAAEYSLTTTDTTLIQGWILDQEQDALKGGFDPAQNLNANWHYVKLYNRILTDNEITQNFNAVRGRFSL